MSLALTATVRFLFSLVTLESLVFVFVFVLLVLFLLFLVFALRVGAAGLRGGGPSRERRVCRLQRNEHGRVELRRTRHRRCSRKCKKREQNKKATPRKRTVLCKLGRQETCNFWPGTLLGWVISQWKWGWGGVEIFLLENQQCQIVSRKHSVLPPSGKSDTQCPLHFVRRQSPSDHCKKHTSEGALT